MNTHQPIAPPNDTRGSFDLSHSQQSHIGPLDGLRGLAALLVVSSHMAASKVVPFFNSQIGNYGVFLFFVLSGFLMSHLYLAKSITRDRMMTYFSARISRIVPIYYLVIAASFLYGRYVDPGFVYAMTPFDFIRSLLFISNVAVFWSIGPEFQFYFMFPLLWWLISQRSEKALIWGAPVTAVTLAIFLYRWEWPGVIVLSKLHIFLGGILIGLIRPRLVNKMTPRAMLTAQITATIILVVIMLPRHLVGDMLYPLRSDIKHNEYYADFSKLFLLMFVVGSFSFTTKYADTLFSNTFARLVGKYSFSVYLLHAPVLYAFEKLGVFSALPLVVTLPLTFAAVIAVAGVSFHCLENTSRVAARSALLRLFRVTGRRSLSAR